MRPPLTASVVQAGSLLFDTPGTLEKFGDLLADAARSGARFVVFPEAFVGGYPKGADFGAPVGSRSDEGRELFRRYFESAIEADGAEARQMAALARKARADVVVGVVERAPKGEGGGTLYCTALFLARDGRILGKRRKLMPTAAERVIWGMGDGSTLGAVDFAAGRASAAICWENYMPALRMSLYAEGVELYCAPTVDDRESWQALMRTAALEGRCFVLSANQFMTRADAPPDFRTARGDDPKTILINGGSVIVSPLGAVLKGPVFGAEAILTAELDFAEIARGKMDFDAAGHYARPDVFELKVDRRAKRPVSDA